MEEEEEERGQAIYIYLPRMPGDSLTCNCMATVKRAKVKIGELGPTDLQLTKILAKAVDSLIHFYIFVWTNRTSRWGPFAKLHCCEEGTCMACSGTQNTSCLT